MSFEDKLKAFMSDSESRQADAPRNRSQERFAPPQIKKKTEGNLGFAFFYMPVHEASAGAFRHRLSGAYELR